jgi:hypothetical protein
MGATTEDIARNSADMAWLLTTVEANERTLRELLLRLETVENELANAVRRRDSVEIGTAGKGGGMKVYFDALGCPDDNDRAVEEARRVLTKAGGTPAPANGGA